MKKKDDALASEIDTIDITTALLALQTEKTKLSAIPEGNENLPMLSKYFVCTIL